jgi:hypothetical protein
MTPVKVCSICNGAIVGFGNIAERVVGRRGGARIGIRHLARPKRSRNVLPVSCWP